jgi:hypothetical protein
VLQNSEELLEDGLGKELQKVTKNSATIVDK